MNVSNDPSTTVLTSSGPVEVVLSAGSEDVILYFHGGHESGVAPAAADIYRRAGYRVLTVSRPGYGATSVGPLSPAAFAPLVAEVCRAEGVRELNCVVGTSAGGQSAVQFAGQYPELVASLILHSAAPSAFPYPDVVAQRMATPLIFNPRLEGATWAMVRSLMHLSPALGLRATVGPLSRRPLKTWLPSLSAEDRAEIAQLFSSSRSGSGFVNDVRHSGPLGSDDRARAQARVACPTLVTASRDDGAVAFRHAENFTQTIPGARLAETDAPSHLFWIGPCRAQIQSIVEEFLDSP